MSRPDIDNLSTNYINKLSICGIDKICLAIRHKDKLSICGIDKLYLSGINRHNFFYIVYGQFVYISYGKMLFLYDI